MKYVAEYRLGDVNVDALLLAVQDLLSSDCYYPVQGSRTDLKCGTGLVQFTNGFTKTMTPVLESLIGWTPGLEDIEGVELKWRTCNNNLESLTLKEGVITYVREGRRHGITGFFENLLREVNPDRVIEYSSQRDDVSPFEKGLLPPERGYEWEELEFPKK